MFSNSFPSLLIFTKELNLNVDAFSQVLMIIGLVSSLGIMFRPSALLFLVNWSAYLSFLLVGQTFLSFQWDILLVEMGFLCIFSAGAPAYAPIAWLYRFLAFKLMFMSGIVKMKANCPTWQQLTALEYHFATQPLPTPVSHWAHSLPPVVLRLGVLGTMLAEVPLPFLLLSPLTSMRRWGAGIQIALQVGIALTGNYTFFNVLTVALMLQCWSDSASTRADLSFTQSAALSR